MDENDPRVMIARMVEHYIGGGPEYTQRQGNAVIFRQPPQYADDLPEFIGKQFKITVEEVR